MKKRIKYLEENQDLLLKLQDDYKQSLEFTDEDSSLDYAWGLEELDLEDRIIIKNRQRKMIPKKETNLNIKTHIQILSEFVKDLENLQEELDKACNKSFNKGVEDLKKYIMWL